MDEVSKKIIKYVHIFSTILFVLYELLLQNFAGRKSNLEFACRISSAPLTRVTESC